MRPAPAPRKAVALAAGFIAARAAVDLRLRSGDERRQAIDAAGVCDHRLGLRLRLILRLRAVFAVALLFARRLLALIGLTVTLLIARAVVAHIGLRLHGHEAGLLAEAGEILAVVLAVLARAVVQARLLLLLLRLVLAELFLGGGERFPRRRRRPHGGPRPEGVPQAAAAAPGDDFNPGNE